MRNELVGPHRERMGGVWGSFFLGGGAHGIEHTEDFSPREPD